MDGKTISEVQSGGNRSIKDAVISVKKIGRKSAIRMAWMVLAAGPLNVMVGTVVQAGESSNAIPHKTVKFNDLNLNSPEGAAVLFGRIKAAAYEVCARPDRYDLSQWRLRICINDSVSEAVTKVNRPMLTSLYGVKTGKTVNKVTTLARTQ